MKKLLIVLVLSFVCTIFYGQSDTTIVEKEKSSFIKFDAGLDLYTTWIWRGQKMHSGPDMQPIINSSIGSFNLGAVGVISWPMDNYYEVDIYALYDFKYFTPIVTDYWIALNDSVKYFDWDSDNTGHFVEVGLIIPFKDFTLSGYTFVYGADRDENGDSYYSTYIELGYDFTPTFSAGIGATIGAGFYKQGDYTKELSVTEEGFAIVNLNISKRFFVKKIPIDTYFIVNPQASRVHVTAIVRLFEN